MLNALARIGELEHCQVVVLMNEAEVVHYHYRYRYHYHDHQ